jgi:hypothetical protein
VTPASPHVGFNAAKDQRERAQHYGAESLAGQFPKLGTDMSVKLAA